MHARSCQTNVHKANESFPRAAYVYGFLIIYKPGIQRLEPDSNITLTSILLEHAFEQILESFVHSLRCGSDLLLLGVYLGARKVIVH